MHLPIIHLYWGRVRLAPVVFVLYLFFSFSTLFFLSWSSLIQLQVTYGWTKTGHFCFISIFLFLYIISFIMILFNPTSSYLCQGTEVNKNYTSYTSVVSPQKKKKKKKKKKKEKKNKERVWGQTREEDVEYNHSSSSGTFCDQNYLIFLSYHVMGIH